MSYAYGINRLNSWLVCIMCQTLRVYVPQVFTAPPDPHLLKYIEEVNESIMPLPSSREQVVALAKYVTPPY